MSAEDIYSKEGGTENARVLPQPELKQRVSVVFFQTLAKLAVVPEFAASPRVPHTSSDRILPLKWRRDATVERGQSQYGITHLYYAEDLQHLSVCRKNATAEELEWVSIDLDLQERKATRSISPSHCGISYSKYGSLETTDRDTDRAFKMGVAIIDDLVQKPIPLPNPKKDS